MHRAHVDMLDEASQRLSQTVAKRLAPVEADLQRLETIPGVKRRTAEVLAAETGLEMTRFSSAGHLASWAGMCPGSYESAGKRKGGKTRPGASAQLRVVEQLHRLGYQVTLTPLNPYVSPFSPERPTSAPRPPA